VRISAPLPNAHWLPADYRFSARTATDRHKRRPGIGYAVPVPYTTPDVFVSYAREDVEATGKIVGALRLEGFVVWTDANIPAGEKFLGEIQKALENSKTVLVLWSLASVDSDWVESEAREGWRQKKLLPVQIAECEPAIIYRGVQTVSLQGWDGDRADPRFRSLVMAIRVRADQRWIESPPQPASKSILQRLKDRRMDSYVQSKMVKACRYDLEKRFTEAYQTYAEVIVKKAKCLPSARLPRLRTWSELTPQIRNVARSYRDSANVEDEDLRTILRNTEGLQSMARIENHVHAAYTSAS
jgi:hypothetical protein